MPVVKANAYGHGSTHLAKYLQDNGYRQFAVATALEGEELRAAGITGNIHVLGTSLDIYITEIVLNRSLLIAKMKLDKLNKNETAFPACATFVLF